MHNPYYSYPLHRLEPVPRIPGLVCAHDVAYLSSFGPSHALCAPFVPMSLTPSPSLSPFMSAFSSNCHWACLRHLHPHAPPHRRASAVPHPDPLAGDAWLVAPIPKRHAHLVSVQPHRSCVDQPEAGPCGSPPLPIGCGYHQSPPPLTQGALHRRSQ
jgi:hypothetical protein